MILLVEAEVGVSTTDAGADAGTDAAEVSDVAEGANAVLVLAELCVHDGLASNDSVIRGEVVNESGVVGQQHRW